jgi:enolase
MPQLPIADIHAREILDSRGFPTVEVDVRLQATDPKSGCIGRAAVPSGASTGSHEAWERRDGDAHRYGGKGVLHAVQAVNTTLSQALIGHDVMDQAAIDQKMCTLDGTVNKSVLGANAILAVSLAVADARARAQQQPLYRSLCARDQYHLPIPMMNVLNGGAHADNPLDVQEIMIAPVQASSMAEAVRCGAEIFHALKSGLKAKGYATNVGDEGGFAPHIPSLRQALECVAEAVERAGYRLGTQVRLALDVAASEFYRDGQYVMAGEGLRLDAAQMVDYYAELIKAFDIFSIEDGFAEDDWAGWALMTARLGDHIQLVGDDLFVTNLTRLNQGITDSIANAILIKMNQIGTLTETVQVMERARQAGYVRIVSHRSGETEDTFLADLAVAFDAEYVKTGSLSRSDRVAKYNRFLRIEEELGPQGIYRGRAYGLAK